MMVMAGRPYLDVVVDASGQDLIAGVVEGDRQHLVRVLEGVDRPLLAYVPQLSQQQNDAATTTTD